MTEKNTLTSETFVTLALSGGGSRAMAFHLGCLRALHDRGLLDQVKVVSTVSGGSVIGACLAYWGVEFAEFDRRIVKILRKGFNRSIARSVFFSWEAPKIFATLLVTAASSMSLGALSITLALLRITFLLPTRGVERRLAELSGQLPIWGSLTTAFEDALVRTVFGDASITDVRWKGVEVIINACDLRTGTAFRFGSQTSGGWRYGRIEDNRIPVARAVAASAAFPLLLPPLIQNFSFINKNQKSIQKVVLTDGGVFENLGVAVLEPGRNAEISVNSFSATHIISLNAGAGQGGGESSPFWWISRVKQSFETVHRKVQDATYNRLHQYARSGLLKGFGMVYLGQIDDRLPIRPPDLVRREDVKDYPTNFAPMAQHHLDALTLRGEQLTHVIIDRYLSDL
ncbi:patatin-like phospholipase family protein [Burkholderia cepacia]|uniref:patatin-like phospholipase family protein n=1 Tax=Burkholderia cepacia TaxID=292 RepID=UPI002AB69FDF|nr:patatin-like phospholipase family protein [Burkholderia cepacia]